jgi:hypothetical protein
MPYTDVRAMPPPERGAVTLAGGPLSQLDVPVMLSPGTYRLVLFPTPLATTTMGSSHEKPGGAKHVTVKLVADEALTLQPRGSTPAEGPPDGVGWVTVIENT